MKKRSLLITLIALIVLYVCYLLVINSYGITPPGEGGVLVTLGNVAEKTNQGFTLKWPFVSELRNYNTKQQTKDFESIETKTQGLQNVYLSLSVIYRINSDKLPEMIKDIDMTRYQEDILAPKVEATIANIIGKNEIWLLVSQLSTVTEAVEYALSDVLKDNDYIKVSDVMIKAPKFDKSFEDEVLAKLTDEVKIERAKNQTKIVNEEATQMFLKASVEPRVVAQLSKVLTNPLIIKYEATKALQNWKGDSPGTIVIGSEQALPIIGIDNENENKNNKTKVIKPVIGFGSSNK